MLDRRWIKALVLTTALLLPGALAQAFDDAQYPDLKGQWNRLPPGNPRFDPTKPRGLEQLAPLTPEFQRLYEASLADQAAGGQGNHAGYTCMAWGMPAMMNLYDVMEIIVLPNTTYMMIDDTTDSLRRIFTDGRDWPADAEAAYNGYSIGTWRDTDGDGRFDTLEVETRNFKGPRVYEASGIPLHRDNESIVKERIALDKENKDLLRYEITTIDHALTQPWTVMKTFRRERNVMWYEENCGENNNHVVVGKEFYFLSADGYLMPVRKDQPPPDARYFKTTGK
jgi:hypothetical protein